MRGYKQEVMKGGIILNKKIIFKKEMPKWKEKSPFEKGSTVFTLILSISVLILSTLTLVGS